MQLFSPPKMTGGQWALFAGHIGLLALSLLVAAAQGGVDQAEGAFWGIVTFFAGIALEGVAVLTIRSLRKSREG
jgi:hypothetical protein